MKVLAALTSLVVMIGLFVTSLTRGFNGLYPILIAVTALVTAVLVGVILYRRKNRRR